MTAIRTGLSTLLSDDWIREIASIPAVKFDLQLRSETHTGDLSWIPDYDYSSLVIRHHTTLKTLSGMPSRVDALNVIGNTKLTSLNGISSNLTRLSIIDMRDIGGKPIDLSAIASVKRLKHLYYHGDVLPRKILGLLSTEVCDVTFNMVGEYWYNELEPSTGESNISSKYTNRSQLLNGLVQHCVTARSRRNTMQTIAGLRAHGIILT